MTLISEPLHRLQLSSFLETSNCSKFQEFFEKVGEVQELFNADDLYIRRIQKRLKECKDLLQTLLLDIQSTKKLENYRASSLSTGAYF